MSPTIYHSLFVGRETQRWKQLGQLLIVDFSKSYVLSKQLECKLCEGGNQVLQIFMSLRGLTKCFYKVGTQSVFNNWLDLKAYILIAQLYLAGIPRENEPCHHISLFCFRMTKQSVCVFVGWQLWWREGCLVIVTVQQPLW